MGGKLGVEIEGKIKKNVGIGEKVDEILGENSLASIVLCENVYH